ncbi:MAG: GatB/YqeY domain-containing protein [Pseudomonadota bacterium]|nr:GatB/YqeY domain-containing protein [Pseudomonadota bacterium]
MREKFSSELRAAMKAGEKRRVGTIRMIMAALKDKEIEARGQGKTVSDEDILALLQKMTKSRKESQEIYEKAGRVDLATQESEEIAIIQGFLPQQLSEAEVAQAIAAALAETTATSIKDMGKVVGALKGKYAGRMDFAKASVLVKRMLGG